MKKISLICSLLIYSLLWSITTGSCRKLEVDLGDTTHVPLPLDTGSVSVSDTTVALKDAADFYFGASISTTAFLQDPLYAGLVKSNFDGVTFEAALKHGQIVQNDGSLNFSQADNLLASVGDLQVFGHALAWHVNQNTTYLNQLVGVIQVRELLNNPGFELDGNGDLNAWYVYNSGNPKGTAILIPTSQADQVHGGSSAMSVNNPTAYPGNQWRVQLVSNIINTVIGKRYSVSYWVKAETEGGSIQLATQTENGGANAYQGDKPTQTDWQQITWSFVATDAQTRLIFNMGQAANHYYLDDVSVVEDGGSVDMELARIKLDTALHQFITATVSRYKSKIHAWDVVNELFTDAGDIRNDQNSPTPVVNGQPAYGYFRWSQYLGRDYGLKAFEYAAQADPTAELYINEYGLEYSPKKTDSLIAYVNEIIAKGAKVDGIGTQMHIQYNSDKNKIDLMLQKLAATGLKIRISELDIKTTLSDSPVALTQSAMDQQALMIKFVVSSYLKFIPKAQRAGITLWGVTDPYSWLYNNGAEYPCIFNKDYQKKPAYLGILQGLSMQ